MKPPVALTIAGSDSGGGAGIQADLKAFQAFGVYGASAITAITAQNSRGVTRAEPLPADLVAAQVEAVLCDLPVAAAKTGMLGSAAVVEAVSQVLARWPVPRLVVDPVIYAKDGTALLDAQGAERLVEMLFPLATLITPNAPEAGALTGTEVSDEASAAYACELLARRGPRGVLLKGGHLVGEPVDLLWEAGKLTRLCYPRVEGVPVHGTGCTLSAAITALLARGMPLAAAVTKARAWLQAEIARAQVLGGGFRLFLPPE